MYIRTQREERNMSAIKEVLAAVMDQLGLDDIDDVTITNITVTLTMDIDNQSSNDWLDEWYEAYQHRYQRDYEDIPPSWEEI